MRTIAHVGSAIVAVARRLRWAIVLGVLLLAATASQPASLAVLMLTCLAAFPFLGLASSALGIDPFSPSSVVRSMFKAPSWKQLGLATALLVLTLGIIRLGLFIPHAATWLVDKFGGDRDLATALMFAVISALACATMAWVESRIHSQGMVDAPSDAEGDPATVSAVDLLNNPSYWWKAAEALTLASIALVPAALLANWAWNVLASVALPVFYLSVRDSLQ